LPIFGDGGDLLVPTRCPQRLDQPRCATRCIIPCGVQRAQQPRGVQLTNLRLDRHSAGECKLVVRAPHPLAHGHALGQGVDVNGNIVWAVHLILDALDDWHHRGDTNDGLVAAVGRPNGDGADLVPEHLGDFVNAIDERHTSTSTSTSTAISTALRRSAVSSSQNVTTSNSNVSHSQTWKSAESYADSLRISFGAISSAIISAALSPCHSMARSIQPRSSYDRIPSS